MRCKLTILVLLILAVSLNGCKSKEDKGTEADSNTTGPNTASEISDDNVILTVNGICITDKQLEQKFNKEVEKVSKQMPAGFLDQYKKALRDKLLNEMIVEIILDQKVIERNIVVTEKDVNRRIKEMTSKQKMPFEEFVAMLKAKGQNLDQCKQELRKDLAYEKLMESELADSINITEEEAKNYCSQNPEQFQTPEHVRASHILIRLNFADPDEVKKKAKEKAQSLLEQIKGGADFSELARANSDCPSALRGGDLNFFRRGAMVPAFEEAAFELDVGQVSDIIETQFGLHIIKVTDKKDAQVSTFEEVKSDIKQRLTRNKQRELSSQYIEKLKKNAQIVYPARANLNVDNLSAGEM